MRFSVHILRTPFPGLSANILAAPPPEQIMHTDTLALVKLEDYSPPPWLVNTVHLDVDIRPQGTLVVGTDVYKRQSLHHWLYGSEGRGGAARRQFRRAQVGAAYRSVALLHRLHARWR